MITYDKETIEQINANVDLVAYVSQMYNLKKKGKDYFMCCPLHIDNTPSLSFNSEKNLFYCFSCGRGGGAISYFQQFEKMPIDDAIKKAMSLSGINPNSLCTSPTMVFLKNIKPTNTNNVEVKHNVLNKNIYNNYSKEPITLWEEEGISSQVMDLFEVRIDKKSNRIVYPVYDNDGNFINVKGRTLYSNFKELKIPKYMNYYPIGTMDYFQGMNVAKDYINDEIIIFESIKSVMKAFDWGYKNCVSAEKHTLTSEQEDILIKMGKNIVFAFDTDVDYNSPDIKKTLDKLKRITNVYIITSRQLLGGVESKNSPVDCGKEIWEEAYKRRVKII